VYCGSIDRIDIAEAGEARGFVIADVASGRATHEFVEIDACRPMLDIFLEVGSEKPTGTVIEALRSYNMEGAIVRLTVACEGGRRGGVDEGQVRAAMRTAQDVSLVYQSLANPREAVTAAAQPADVRAQLESYLNRPDLRGRKQSLLRVAEPLIHLVTTDLADKETSS
jgi:DNA repair exonuclease SbcCD nuclease subunit